MIVENGATRCKTYLYKNPRFHFKLSCMSTKTSRRMRTNLIFGWEMFRVHKFMIHCEQEIVDIAWSIIQEGQG